MALAATFANKHDKLPTEIFLAFVGICWHLPTSLGIPWQACKNGWQVAKKIGICHDQALLGMACDRSRTPWRTPSGSKECNRSHALFFQTRIKILYFSVTISQSGSTKSKILNDLIVIYH